MRMETRLALTTIVIVLTCGGYSLGSEMPGAQEWTFEMEKLWEIQRAGEDTLLRPAEPRVADDGTLYVHDFERHVSYIIDNNGSLVTTFAPRGEGEGEVPMYINCFPAGDQVVICALDKLHFFDREGQFVKAVPNNLFVRFPLGFKSEEEFWVAPGALGDSPESLAVVTHVNLASGEETVFHRFTRSDEESKPTGGAVIPGLTPQVKMGFDRQADRTYFGKNTDSVVYWRGGDDGGVGLFSFTGTRNPVSEDDKKNHFAGHDIPEEYLAPMMAALPDQMAYYNRIQVIAGLVYLFSSQSINQAQTGQDVNVYSRNGRHLYYGRIQLEDGWHLSTPDNLQLAGGFVYSVQQNDAGEKRIVKYTIALPRS